MANTHPAPLLAAAALLALAGCTANPEKPTAAATPAPTATPAASAAAQAEVPAPNNRELYEVRQDGRIHVFYDRATYQDFLTHGETAYRLTRIGAGPKGETLVFGLNGADKKLGAATPGVMLWEGKLAPAADFYAELRQNGRIYVFDRMEDMQPVREFGHPNFFFLEVGAGPQGESVVYVLNSDNKKHRPEALIARFKQENGLR